MCNHIQTYINLIIKTYNDIKDKTTAKIEKVYLTLKPIKEKAPAKKSKKPNIKLVK